MCSAELRDRTSMIIFSGRPVLHAHRREFAKSSNGVRDSCMAQGDEIPVVAHMAEKDLLEVCRRLSRRVLRDGPSRRTEGHGGLMVAPKIVPSVSSVPSTARICAAAPARRRCQGSSLRLGGVGVTSGILIRWRMERSMRRRTGLGSRLAGHGGERLQPRRNYQPVPCHRLTSPTPVCWRQAPARLVTPTRTPSRPPTSAAPLPTPAHRHRWAADMAFVDRRYHVPALPCWERKIRVFTVWLTALGGRFAHRNLMRLPGIGVVALPAGWLLFAIDAGNSVAVFGFMSAITRPPACDQRPLKPAAGFWRIPVPPLRVTGFMS